MVSWSQEHETAAMTLACVVGVLDRAAALAFERADDGAPTCAAPTPPSPWYCLGTDLYLAAGQARALASPAPLEHVPGTAGQDIVRLLHDAEELLADVDPATVPGVSQLVVAVCDLLHEVGS